MQSDSHDIQLHLAKLHATVACVAMLLTVHWAVISLDAVSMDVGSAFFTLCHELWNHTSGWVVVVSDAFTGSEEADDKLGNPRFRKCIIKNPTYLHWC